MRMEVPSTTTLSFPTLSPRMRMEVPSTTTLSFPTVSPLLTAGKNIVGYFLDSPRKRRFQWPRSLRRRSTAACLLGLRVRIPPGAWLSVSCECCVLSVWADHSSRGLLPSVVRLTE
jgi:hypothetical protein